MRNVISNHTTVYRRKKTKEPTKRSIVVAPANITEFEKLPVGFIVGAGDGCPGANVGLCITCCTGCCGAPTAGGCC